MNAVHLAAIARYRVIWRIVNYAAREDAGIWTVRATCSACGQEHQAVGEWLQAALETLSQQAETCKSIPIISQGDTTP